MLAVGNGVDTIIDFQARIDLIGLFGALGFGQLSISQAADDALIGFRNEKLAILAGVNANTLTEASFIPV